MANPTSVNFVVKLRLSDQLRQRLRIGHRQDEILHDRIDLTFPAPAAEHTIMADAGLQMMPFHERFQSGAQIMRGQGLARSADIVALALYRQKTGAADPGGIDLEAAESEAAFGQGGALED